MGLHDTRVVFWATYHGTSWDLAKGTGTVDGKPGSLQCNGANTGILVIPNYPYPTTLHARTSKCTQTDRQTQTHTRTLLPF